MTDETTETTKDTKVTAMLPVDREEFLALMNLVALGMLTLTNLDRRGKRPDAEERGAIQSILSAAGNATTKLGHERFEALQLRLHDIATTVFALPFKGLMDVGIDSEGRLRQTPANDPKDLH